MRPVACFSDLLHCFEQIAANICPRLYARGIEPSTILQLILLVETEEVRRALSVIGSRHLLRLVDT